MDFRILGPTEVTEEGRPLALGGPRQRALLGMLLLHANEVVSSDRLVDELWTDERRGDGAKALQVAVSRLRKALQPALGRGATSDLIATRPPGYELCVAPERVDAKHFEALLDEGRRALEAGDARAARHRLDDALRLWRGPPLADLAYESFCQAEVGRLEELRIAALEERIEADLALGRHAELIPELHALVEGEPLRERLRGQLMLALYRAGRQAQALETYAEARSALVEQLGIEPGRGLRDLQAAILAQDPTLDAGTEIGTRALQPATGQARGLFVGRSHELSELERALDGAVTGRGRVVLLAGEPGIGKSRLAEELMTEARGRGARVLVGRCWEAGGAPAYWPWVQSLRAHVRETEPDELRAQLGDGAADLAQLLPELRTLFPGLPEPPALDSDGARFRLFEAVAAFLRNVTATTPLVVVLDDMHAADEPSLLLLRFVAREIGHGHLLLVCAFRDVDPTLSAPLTSAVAELVREPDTLHITLGGLQEDHVAEYLELFTGTEPPPGLVHAVYTETEGSPLFVAEVVRLLEADGRIGEPDAHHRIPQGVRAVISQRVGRLPEDARRLLLPASVLGREFRLDALARVVNLSELDVLSTLEAAVTERVVGEVPGSPGLLRFGHALIRDTLYEELAPARRLELHREVGEALESLYGAAEGAHLAELAHHFFAASSTGLRGKAIHYARQGGDQAASVLAYEEAVRLYDTALELADDDLTRCELLLASGEARARAGDTPASKRTFREAALLAERRGMAEHLGEAALGYGGRILWEVSREDPYTQEVLERALAVLEGDSTLRVRVSSRLAAGPLRNARLPVERRRLLAREALEMARRIGDRGALAYALGAYITANHRPDFTPEQLQVADEQIHVGRAGDLERAAEGHEHRATAMIELGDVQGAQAELEAMEKVAGELRQPAQSWLASVYLTLIELLRGEFSGAEAMIADTREVGEQAQSWNATVTYRLQLYVLRREQGRLGEMEELVRRSLEEYPTYPIWRCVLIHMAAELGYMEEARTELRSLAAEGFSALPVDEEWMTSLALLAEPVAALGDAETAGAIHALMLPYADRCVISYPEISSGSSVPLPGDPRADHGSGRCGRGAPGGGDRVQPADGSPPMGGPRPASPRRVPAEPGIQGGRRQGRAGAGAGDRQLRRARDERLFRGRDLAPRGVARLSAICSRRRPQRRGTTIALRPQRVPPTAIRRRPARSRDDSPTRAVWQPRTTTQRSRRVLHWEKARASRVKRARARRPGEITSLLNPLSCRGGSLRPRGPGGLR